MRHCFFLQSTSVLLLRKKYVQDPAHDLWEKYATEEWRLESDQSALIRFEAVVQDVMEISTSPRRETDGADVSTDKLRVGVLGRTIRAHHHLANDEERAANLRFISELETVVNKYKDESVIKNEHVEDILVSEGRSALAEVNKARRKKKKAQDGGSVSSLIKKKIEASEQRLLPSKGTRSDGSSVRGTVGDGELSTS